ncbi:hypothetical protein [Desulfosporosinus sp. BICA1-9]|uniref:hypothetical protein n=1 Tax=Desulfosporosinus sp. BICA1-9 TaxID=1531958 RepID=UPI00054B7646|nr:hypothetical protein [Desulfosporosinus sp. BICA1-9]KJS50509.1 MAG: hypothetical protein VR66_02410 [Peptococcaceae bacterium BRH_c23]KJS83560.1 MAG: hypothetical protein JL57_22430 [Desulfosporosinus sp. BICA1-9]HBW36658.1 hypothetical protein [Desulfosporosinus sp.]
MKKAIIFAVVLLLLALVVGCKNSIQNSPVQAPDSIKQEANLKNGDITDPFELEKLWQEYFYDSIANVGSTREFNSAQEIAPLNVARFYGLKYVAEHGKENLETVNESPFQLLPEPENITDRA